MIRLEDPARDRPAAGGTEARLVAEGHRQQVGGVALGHRCRIVRPPQRSSDAPRTTGRVPARAWVQSQPMSTAPPRPVRLYNSLSRAIEPLVPHETGRVGIYTCGPTVYRYAHIGNLRSFLFPDVLRRALEYLGYEVRHVKNITDVGHMRDDTDEDRMELAAETEGKSPFEIAAYYTDAWLADEAAINILPVTITETGLPGSPKKCALPTLP